MVASDRIGVRTTGNSDVVDITGEVSRALESCGLQDGIITVFVAGSTAGVTTVEYEPGLVGGSGQSLRADRAQSAPYATTLGGETTTGTPT